MKTITEGVEFDTIAREWRCKWSQDDDKKSLQELQKVLNECTDDIKKIEGVFGVKRIVCGGCMDFKIVVALSAEKVKMSGDWSSSSSQNVFSIAYFTVHLLSSLYEQLSV
jgi:hypothetical protein